MPYLARLWYLHSIASKSGGEKKRKRKRESDMDSDQTMCEVSQVTIFIWIKSKENIFSICRTFLKSVSGLKKKEAIFVNQVFIIERNVMLKYLDQLEMAMVEPYG